MRRKLSGGICSQVPAAVGPWCLFCFVFAAIPLCALSQDSASDSGVQPLLEAADPLISDFQQQQVLIVQSLQSYSTPSSAPYSLVAWITLNQSILASQVARASEIAANAFLAPLPADNTPNIPPGTPASVAALLSNQAAILNTRAAIHNQVISTLPLSATMGQFQQALATESQSLLQQASGSIQVQSSLAQTLSNDSAQVTIPLPPPFVPPPSISARTAAILALRDQIMRSQIQFHNQLLSATPAARKAALAAWVQQNSPRFQQLQALILNVAPNPQSN